MENYKKLFEGKLSNQIGNMIIDSYYDDLLKYNNEEYYLDLQKLIKKFDFYKGKLGKHDPIDERILYRVTLFSSYIKDSLKNMKLKIMLKINLWSPIPSKQDL